MYTALNISNRDIKIVSLNGRKVTAWASKDLAAGLVRDGTILQSQAVGEAIDELFTSSGIKRTNVIVSIAGLPFTNRLINLPKIKSSLVEEAVWRAAKKEISLPLDELYLSWQAVPSKGDEQRYFILGVPRNSVDILKQTLDTANIETYSIELRPLALARAANRSDAILINMEPDCYDIVLVTNGLPVVVHTITPRSEGTTLEDNVRRLADELTKIVAFNQSDNPDIQLSASTPLLITGESTAKASASKLLQSEIEYTIEPLLPPVEYPDDLPIAAYTESIGLALKNIAVKPSRRGEGEAFYDINLDILADRYLQPKAKPIAYKKILLYGIIVLAVAIILPLYLARNQIAADISTLNDNYTRVSRLLHLANVAYDGAQLTEASINETMTMITTLKDVNESILSPRGIFNTELQKITGVLPANTYFTSIEMNNDSVVIKGEADNVFTVTSYASALEAEGIYSEVRIVQLNDMLVDLPPTGENITTIQTVSIVFFEIICTK
jgi:hypothetical protein